MTIATDEMYGISKDGQAPYIYFSHDPQDRFGDDYGYRLVAVNRRQQPAASFEIVGPFTDQDRERHLADPASWDGERWGAVATDPEDRPTIGYITVSAGPYATVRAAEKAIHQYGEGNFYLAGISEIKNSRYVYRVVAPSGKVTT